MKFTTVLSEAWRNTISGTACFMAVLSALAVLAAAGAVAEFKTSSDILNQAAQYQASGGNVLILNAKDGIDGKSCEQLSSLNSVQASGATRDTVALVVSALPDTQIPSYEVTSGFSKVLQSKRDKTVQGLVVSKELATTLNLSIGNKLSLKDGRQSLIKGIYEYPDDGRTPGYSYAALEETPAQGTFDACWVSMWPQSSQVQDAIWSALTPSAKSDSDNSITISQLNSTQSETFDGRSLYRSRFTAYLPAIFACVGLLLGSVFIWSRRLEIASALHCGVRKSAVVLQTCFEVVIAISLSVCLVLPIVYILGLSLIAAADFRNVFIAALQPACTLWAACLLGEVVMAVSIQEKHLFTYFKER